MESIGGNSYESKFGKISRGDILVILKKDGSRSLIKVERFRESVSSPEDKPKIMVDYIQLLPEISYEPLISLDDFENTVKETRPVMNISDQDFENFLELTRFMMIYEKIKTAFGGKDPVSEAFDEAMKGAGFKPVKAGVAKV